MHCNICDASIAKPDFNSDLNDWEPCGTCLQVIQDTLEGFIDKPFIADEFDSINEIIPLSTLARYEENGYGRNYPFPYE